MDTSQLADAMNDIHCGLERLSRLTDTAIDDGLRTRINQFIDETDPQLTAMRAILVELTAV